MRSSDGCAANGSRTRRWLTVGVAGGLKLTRRSGRELTFWLPLASLVAVEIYARSFEGWGAWSTAPLFLAPFVLSLVIGGAGLVRFASELRARRLRVSTAMLTVAALLPIAWLLVRRHVV